MLVAIADTHGTDDPRLAGRTATAVEDADLVVHAGDLTTERVLDALHDCADVRAVYGNADGDAVRDRLPRTRVVTYAGVRVVVTHRRRGGATALSLLGRERGADLVVFGHTHRPTVAGGPVTLCNPGSHADPRGAPPTHVELRPTDAGLDGRVVTRAGETVERFAVEGDAGAAGDGTGRSG
ncbi:MAG: YfcE family phosphodiesterase [Haloferacaceae archaeon]